jgi:hypothetical protein
MIKKKLGMAPTKEASGKGYIPSPLGNLQIDKK